MKPETMASLEAHYAKTIAMNNARQAVIEAAKGLVEWRKLSRQAPLDKNQSRDR